MEILLWLVPAGVATLVAMIWAAWAGRPEPEETARSRAKSDADYERFSAAILRDHPTAKRPQPVRERDRSSGIAVRPSQRSNQRRAS